MTFINTAFAFTEHNDSPPHCTPNIETIERMVAKTGRITQMCQFIAALEDSPIEGEVWQSCIAALITCSNEFNISGQMLLTAVNSAVKSTDCMLIELNNSMQYLLETPVTALETNIEFLANLCVGAPFPLTEQEPQEPATATYFTFFDSFITLTTNLSVLAKHILQVVTTKDSLYYSNNLANSLLTLAANLSTAQNTFGILGMNADTIGNCGIDCECNFRLSSSFFSISTNCGEISKYVTQILECVNANCCSQIVTALRAIEQQSRKFGIFLAKIIDNNAKFQSLFFNRSIQHDLLENLIAKEEDGGILPRLILKLSAVLDFLDGAGNTSCNANEIALIVWEIAQLHEYTAQLCEDFYNKYCFLEPLEEVLPLDTTNQACGIDILNNIAGNYNNISSAVNIFAILQEQYEYSSNANSAIQKLCLLLSRVDQYILDIMQKNISICERCPDYRGYLFSLHNILVKIIQALDIPSSVINDNCCAKFVELLWACSSKINTIRGLNKCLLDELLNELQQWEVALPPSPVLESFAFIFQKNIPTLKKINAWIEGMAHTITAINTDDLDDYCNSDFCLAYIQNINTELDKNAQFLKNSLSKCFHKNYENLSALPQDQRIQCSDLPEAFKQIFALFNGITRDFATFATDFCEIGVMRYSSPFLAIIAEIGHFWEEIEEHLHAVAAAFSLKNNNGLPVLCSKCTSVDYIFDICGIESDEGKSEIETIFMQIIQHIEDHCCSAMWHIVAKIAQDIQATNNIFADLNTTLSLAALSFENEPTSSPGFFADSFQAPYRDFVATIGGLVAPIAALSVIQLEQTRCNSEKTLQLLAQIQSITAQMPGLALAMAAKAEQRIDSPLNFSQSELVSTCKAFGLNIVNLCKILEKYTQGESRTIIAEITSVLFENLSTLLQNMQCLDFLESDIFCKQPAAPPHVIGAITEVVGNALQAMTPLVKFLLHSDCCDTYAECIYNITNAISDITASFSGGAILAPVAFWIDFWEDIGTLVQKISTGFDVALSWEPKRQCMFYIVQPYLEELVQKVECYAAKMSVRTGIPRKCFPAWDDLSLNCKNDCDYIPALYQKFFHETANFLAELGDFCCAVEGNDEAPTVFLLYRVKAAMQFVASVISDITNAVQQNYAKGNVLCKTCNNTEILRVLHCLEAEITRTAQFIGIDLERAILSGAKAIHDSSISTIASTLQAEQLIPFDIGTITLPDDIKRLEHYVHQLCDTAEEVADKFLC